MSTVQRDAKRLAAYTKDSISRECSPNLLNSTGLSLITSRNILITFNFRRRAICRGASILPSIGNLSKGAINFIEDY